VTHPALGALRLPGSPIRYSRTTPPPPSAPPPLGADTEAVLSRLDED
jgi:crotonobetainyl-CoA:carnitine CoA-transferase CaiB-like acyl-CoA transferase